MKPPSAKSWIVVSIGSTMDCAVEQMQLPNLKRPTTGIICQILSVTPVGISSKYIEMMLKKNEHNAH